MWWSTVSLGRSVSNVSSDTIVTIERGYRLNSHPGTLGKLAKALRVSPADLLEDRVSLCLGAKLLAIPGCLEAGRELPPVSSNPQSARAKCEEARPSEGFGPFAGPRSW